MLLPDWTEKFSPGSIGKKHGDFFEIKTLSILLNQALSISQKPLLHNTLVGRLTAASQINLPDLYHIFSYNITVDRPNPSFNRNYSVR